MVRCNGTFVIVLTCAPPQEPEHSYVQRCLVAQPGAGLDKHSSACVHKLGRQVRLTRLSTCADRSVLADGGSLIAQMGVAQHSGLPFEQRRGS